MIIADGRVAPGVVATGDSEEETILSDCWEKPAAIVNVQV
jgi:hypothetical protein